jgi:hypothetical protein
MRIVVDSCESPKLRVAVETALDETADDTQVKLALELASEVPPR